MKKAILVLLGTVILFCSQIGSAFADTVLDNAVNDLLGSKYKYGGTTEKGFDCSGFTMFVFNSFGIELAHQSKAQAKEGTFVNKSDLRPGDLVFFNTDGKGISHVGIYLGDGEFIHSATNQGVVKNKLSETYYTKRYVTARRIVGDEMYEQLTAQAE